MTALQMNAELFRELSIIAEDEGLMKKAVKYLKKLTAQKQAMDETEYIMSSPKMVEIIRQGQKDIEEGRGRVVKVEDLWK
ncbi:MAG: hypothetical protein J6Z14_10420 [Prevotella sp.]|nr:hypothetical protein [Prevotella sp.]